MGEVVNKKKNFFKGSIVRVKLTNFMSYDAMEFFPGPKLNMVIGPNGSGKSTIVCALALGLGGSPKLLQRANDMKGFVKNGKDDASIEIELYDPSAQDGNPVFVRNFSRLSNKSTWHINGKPVTMEKVKNVLSIKYKCQVDNLCQFLPQDKVSSFSKMNQKELLQETIRAGLGEDYLKKQEELCEMQQELRHAKSTAEQEKKMLEQKEAELATLEKRVELFREREKLEISIKNHKDLVKYLKFDQARKFYTEQKEILSEEKKALPEKNAAIKEVEEELMKHKKKIKSIEKEASVEDKEAFKSVGSHFEKFKKQNERIQDRLYESVNDLKNKVDEQSQLEKRIKHGENEHFKTQEALQLWAQEHNQDQMLSQRNSLGNDQKTVRNRISEIQGNILEQRQGINHIAREIERHQKKIDRAKQRLNSKDLILNKFSHKGQQAKKIWQVIKGKANERQLRDKVYLAALEVFASEPLVAQYAERAVTKDQLCTFITKSQEDRSFCMGLRGADVMNINRVDTSVQRQLSQADLKAMGALGYLDELIGGPPEVVQALRNIAAIHQVVAGTAETEKYLSSLDQKTLAQKFNKLRIFTPDMEFSVRRSRYSNNAIISAKTHNAEDLNNLIRVGRNGGEDGQIAKLIANEEEAIAKLKANMEHHAKEIKDLEEEQANLKEQEKEISSKRVAIQAELEGRRQLIEKAKILQEDIHRLKQQRGTSVVKAAEKPVNAILAVYRKTIAGIGELHTESENVISAVSRMLRVQMKSAAARARKAEVEHRKQKLEAERDHLEGQIAQHQHIVREAKDKAKALKHAFEASNPDKKALEKLAQVSNDVNELMAEIKLLQGKLSSAAHDATIITRYEQLKAEVAELRPRVNANEENKESLTDKYQQKLDAWVGVVENLIQNVNEHFEEGFENVRKQGYECQGNIELLRYADDLKEYGVGINVRFRANQELRKLDIRVHSGGERSFTIFMYLLALNQISDAPFRVVDEINQGMDQQKERMCMAQLINACCGEGQKMNGQYFLITPKLLTGMRFHEDMMMHVIFNGRGALPQQQCNIKRFIQLKKQSRIRNRDDDDDDDDDDGPHQRPKKTARQT